MKSTNPVLSGSAFRVVSSERVASTVMSVKGTVYKASLLLLFTLISASYTWVKFFTEQNPAHVLSFIMVGGVGGFILALVTIFKKEWAQYTSIPYAIFEGLAIGGISSFFEQRFPGIAVQATALTFGVLGIMLVLYTNKIIVVTDKLKKGVIAATLAVGVVYLVSFILGIFGVNIGFLNSSSPFSILISFVIVGIAAFNLLLDFDLIEEGARQGAPKYMEWYAAFGLMVTLIWLYLEILRLLSKIRENKR